MKNSILSGFFYHKNHFNCNDNTVIILLRIQTRSLRNHLNSEWYINDDAKLSHTNLRISRSHLLEYRIRIARITNEWSHGNSYVHSLKRKARALTAGVIILQQPCLTSSSSITWSLPYTRRRNPLSFQSIEPCDYLAKRQFFSGGDDWSSRGWIAGRYNKLSRSRCQNFQRFVFETSLIGQSSGFWQNSRQDDG